jgi:hypothetical protein
VLALQIAAFVVVMTITLVGYYLVLRAWDRHRDHRPIEWVWPPRKVGIKRVDDTGSAQDPLSLNRYLLRL